MLLQLDGQPADILIPIFNKMNPQAQCRLRRCCKRMDNFVETYRSRINKRAGQSQANLYIKIPDWENEPMLFYIIHDYLHWNVLGDWGALFKRYPVRSFCYAMNRLRDVYSQCSAIHFNAIILDFHHIGRFEEAKRRERKNVFVKDHLIPLLRKWRLSCDFLGIDDANRLWLPQILPLITFSRCCLPNISPFIVTSEVVSEMLPIKHCKELFFCTEALDNTEIWMAQFRHLESLRIVWSETYPRDHPLTMFIIKIQENREARGKLKKFTVVYSTWHRSCDGLDADLIWEGTVGHCEYKFYTLDIPGGVALIACFESRGKQTVTIHFLDDVNREILFDFIFPFIFYNTPLDSSVLYNQFLSAETDASAVEILSDCRQIYIDCYNEPTGKMNKIARKFVKMFTIKK